MAGFTIEEILANVEGFCSSGAGQLFGNSEQFRLLCREIERLKAEVERLKEFEWMYKDLCR